MPAGRQLDDLAPLLVSRAEALARGRTPDEVRWLLRTGRWTALCRGLYVPTADLAPETDPHRRF